MVARLKLKGIDGRAPPGVEPAAQIGLRTYQGMYFVYFLVGSSLMGRLGMSECDEKKKGL